MQCGETFGYETTILILMTYGCIGAMTGISGVKGNWEWRPQAFILLSHTLQIERAKMHIFSYADLRGTFMPDLIFLLDRAATTYRG